MLRDISWNQSGMTSEPPNCDLLKFLRVILSIEDADTKTDAHSSGLLLRCCLKVSNSVQTKPANDEATASFSGRRSAFLVRHLGSV
jgi:hypothetical protein